MVFRARTGLLRARPAHPSPALSSLHVALQQPATMKTMKMGLTTVANCRPARREELYARPQLRQREESLRDIADTQEQASAPARAYVNGTTYFNHADGLGTERARSNVSGTRCETITSLPFGDGQTTGGSCGDPSPDHFTGKERDT